MMTTNPSVEARVTKTLVSRKTTNKNNPTTKTNLWLDLTILEKSLSTVSKRPSKVLALSSVVCLI